MFTTRSQGKCRVVKKITDKETFYCLKPATVFLVRNTPEPIAVCESCARELVKELAESFPGGMGDIDRRRK